jgi:hypothetical protein
VQNFVPEFRVAMSFYPSDKTEEFYPEDEVDMVRGYLLILSD